MSSQSAESKKCQCTNIFGVSCIHQLCDDNKCDLMPANFWKRKPIRCGECHSCDRKICHFHMSTCGTCNESTCLDDLSFCSVCENPVCVDDVKDCVGCDKPFCPKENIKTCTVCDKPMCDDCSCTNLCKVCAEMEL